MLGRPHLFYRHTWSMPVKWGGSLCAALLQTRSFVVLQSSGAAPPFKCVQINKRRLRRLFIWTRANDSQLSQSLRWA